MRPAAPVLSFEEWKKEHKLGRMSEQKKRERYEKEVREAIRLWNNWHKGIPDEA